MTKTSWRLTSLTFVAASACAGDPNTSGGSGSSSGGNVASTAPAAPTMLTAELVGRGGHLTWMDNSDNEVVFIIERKTEGGSYGEVTRTPADTAQYHDAPLAPGTYTYRVAANNRAGRSTSSNEASVIVPPLPGGSSSSATAPGSSSASTTSTATSSTTTATSQPGQSSSAATTGSSGPQVVRPNFEDDIIPIFEASCGTGTNGCHSRESYYATANQNCRGWLALENTLLGAQGYDMATLGQPTGCQDRDLYYRITQINAWQCDVPYIVPGNPDGSYIFRKVAGGPYCDVSPGVPSEPMPSGAQALSTQDINTLRTWIQMGAPRR